MEEIPMMNAYDVCRSIQKQHVNPIIRRLITEDDVLSKIILEQKALEKPDKELIAILEKGIGVDTAILIGWLKDHINELNYRRAGKPYDIFRGISAGDTIAKITENFIEEISKVISRLGEDLEKLEPMIQLYVLCKNQYDELLGIQSTLLGLYQTLQQNPDKKVRKQVTDNLLNAFSKHEKINTEDTVSRVKTLMDGIDASYLEIINVPTEDKKLIKSLIDGELGKHLRFINGLFQELIQILQDGDDVIQKLNDYVAELKTRYLTSKRMAGAFEFGKPACATEKIDGTQLRVGFKKGIKPFSVLSHNNGAIVGGKKLITEKDLEPYIPPKHTKPRNVTFQGGDLTLNLIPLLPILRQLMDDYDLEEVWFYFELTFGVGQKTPKQMPYYDNLSIMNKLYLFGMSYNLYDDAGIPTDIVKLTVNPETQPIFHKYGINTVPIILSTESFEAKHLEEIFQFINNTNYEGAIFCQEDCYLKLLTVYYTEELSVYPIEHEINKRYAGLQTMYKHYMNGRVPRVKLQTKKGGKKFNKELVENEIRTELSHDGAKHKEALTRFYSIPSKAQEEVRQCLADSELYTDIFASVAGSSDFADMTKKTKNKVFDTVLWYLINEKKDIKKQFEISTSIIDSIKEVAPILE